jgi:hypothetical protein
MEQITNLFNQLYDLDLLWTLGFYILISSLTFSSSLKLCGIKNIFAIVTKYALALVTVNIVTKIFIILLYPNFMLGPISLEVIMYVTIFLLGVSIIVRHCSTHITTRITKKIETLTRSF